MRFALFGKLQAKRDFIAIDMPRGFLTLWEPWMQGSIAASRQQLGPRWQQCFLTAPVWRFWLGAELCGTTVMGAIMPSMDGAGRYFPLTIAAVADAGEAIAPPEHDPQDAWCAKIDEFLFATLDTGLPFTHFTDALATLPPPKVFEGVAGGARLLPQGAALAAQDGSGTRDAFARARMADPVRAHASSSFWWTASGQGFEAFALACQRMPDPFLYSGMVSGQFTQDPVPV